MSARINQLVRIFVMNMIGVLLLTPAVLWADTFTIRDIRIVGLDKISEGLVINSLPVRIGQDIDESDNQRIINALYEKGFFSDIKVGRDKADILVVQVTERASIRSISVKGNKALKTEALLDGLKAAGLAENEVYNPAILESIRQELVREYVSQGMYQASVKTEIEKVENNQVEVTIRIDESKIAKVKSIDIIGNQSFSDKELKLLMAIKDSVGLKFWSKKNRYLKSQLQDDVENIRSHYLDNGYLKFSIESVQVNVDREREGVAINIALNEGDVYAINNVRFISQDFQQESDIEEKMDALKGQIYSQKKVTAIEEVLKHAFGTQGFAFARVRGVPQFVENENAVDVIFAVEKGKRSYVRRINFAGNTKTQDKVLRREMRQLESAPANTSLIAQSKLRLQRLGFFKDVKVETVAVPGHDDLVDVNFTVEEDYSGSIGASVGFADGSGLQLGGNLQQNNFMGTGNRVNIGLNRSKYQTSFNFGITNPYFTKDGVSRGFNVFYRETDLGEVNVSSYNVNRFGVNLSFGYPLSETQRLGFVIGGEKIEIDTGSRVVQEIETTPATPNGTGFVDIHGDSYDLFTLQAFWRQSSLNRGRFATKGSSQTLSFESTLPGVDLEYYKLSYKGQKFFPLNDDYSFRVRTKLGYGDSYGDTERLPFFENFFSGGFNSVRGFEQNTLGPLSTNAAGDTSSPDPFGGNVVTEIGADFIFPTPFVQDKRSVQTSLFVDGGNVFDDNCSKTQGNCSTFKADELRFSAGIGVNWHTIIGPMSFSLAKPIQHDDDIDDTKVFQFSIGTSF